MSRVLRNQSRKRKCQQDLDDIIKRVQDAEPPSKPQPIAEKPTAGIQVIFRSADEYHYRRLLYLRKIPLRIISTLETELKQNAELLVVH